MPQVILEVMMTRLILIIGLLLLSRGSALAIDWKWVSHEKAKIVASLDWSWAKPEEGEYFGAWTDNYGKYVEFARWSDGRYPRLELNLQRLSPRRYWGRVSRLEKEILTWWEHLKNASLNASLSEIETFECNAEHCIRFTAEQVNCLAFRYLTGPHGDRDEGDQGTNLVTGYYCADYNDDAPITLIDKIINSIELRE